MLLKDLDPMIAGIGLPYKYYAFPKPGQAPPYIVYYSPGRSDLFADNINPLTLNGFPSSTNILAALVLDSLQSVFGHVASEYLLLTLRRTHNEYEYTRGNSRENLFWQFDDFG